MDKFTSVGHNEFNDIAFVIASKRFDEYEEIYKNNPQKIVGAIYSNSEYIRLDDMLVHDSEQIKISDLTQDKIDTYTQNGMVVYFISRTKGYSAASILSTPKIFVIEKVLAPLLVAARYVCRLWKDDNTDYEYDYNFVSFNTRGSRPYGHSSVETIEFLQVSIYDGDIIDDYYRIIDNTVALSIDTSFDSDGEVSGREHTVYIFDKRDGAYETHCYETAKLKAKMSNGKYDCYDSVLNNFYEYDGKTTISGIIGIACKLFDTIDVKFFLEDRDYVYVKCSCLDKWDDNTYVIDDNYPYTTIIKRENSKSSFDIVTINESDEEDE